MIKVFEFDLIFKNCAMKISKSMIDIHKFFFVHNDETIKDELTFDINISSKFKQKRRRKNRNEERTSIRRRQIVKNVNVIEKLIQLQKKKLC